MAKAAPPIPPDDEDAIPEGPTLPPIAPGGPAPIPKADPATGDPESALIALMNQRSGDPQNLDLRDQEHEAFSRYMLHRLGPVLGPAVVASSVPAYSGIKGAVQAMGGMQDATPASFREVRAGLRPLWQAGFGSLKPIINHTFENMKGSPMNVTRPGGN